MDIASGKLARPPGALPFWVAWWRIQPGPRLPSAKSPSMGRSAQQVLVRFAHSHNAGRPNIQRDENRSTETNLCESGDGRDVRDAEGEPTLEASQSLKQ